MCSGCKFVLANAVPRSIKVFTCSAPSSRLGFPGPVIGVVPAGKITRTTARFWSPTTAMC